MKEIATKEINLWALFIKGEFYTANSDKSKLRYMASVQKKYGVGNLKIVKCKLIIDEKNSL